MRRLGWLMLVVGMVVAACQTDVSSKITGPRYSLDFNSVVYTFKVQVGSTWYPMVSPGDFIAGHPSDSTWSIMSDGTLHTGIAVSSIAIDTVGWPNTRQLYARYPFLSFPKQGDFYLISSHNQVLDDIYMARYDTLMMDNVSADSSYWHVRSAGTYSSFTQGNFKADNVGSFRFATCAQAPTCLF